MKDNRGVSSRMTTIISSQAITMKNIPSGVHEIVYMQVTMNLEKSTRTSEEFLR
jgi:hypothetical protein